MALAKAQVAQASEDLAVCIHDARLDGRTIAHAVGVAERRICSFGLARDPKLTAVRRAMVRRAQGEQVLCDVRAAFGARRDVMDVHEGRAPIWAWSEGSTSGAAPPFTAAVGAFARHHEPHVAPVSIIDASEPEWRHQTFGS